jgi:small multidrug resistance family-3 protein
MRTAILLVTAACAEIAGAYLIWGGLREGRGPLAVGLGAAALVGYGVIATFHADNSFGRVMAAYGGVFVAGSLLCGVAIDGFRPAWHDWAGALICILGVALIMIPSR